MFNEYIAPLRVSQNALARAIGVTPRSVNEIVLGRRGISAAMSIRLGKFFGNPPGFWLEMQMTYDLAIALADFEKLPDVAIVQPESIPPLKKSSIDEDERTTWLL